MSRKEATTLTVPAGGRKAIVRFVFLVATALVTSCSRPSGVECSSFGEQQSGPCLCGSVTTQHLNLETGRIYPVGLSGAKIFARSAAHERTVTGDGDGVFVVPIDQAGAYRIEARLGDGTYLASGETNGRLDGTCRPIQFSLAAQSQIRLEVESATYPITIDLYEFYKDNPNPVIMTGMEVSQNETVEFSGLRPGRYRIAARTSKTLAYYPGVVDQGEALDVMLGPSELTLPRWRIARDLLMAQ